MSKKADRLPFGPKDFLASLGIERPPKGGIFTEKFYDEIRAKGFDPGIVASGDGFHPEAGSVYFCDIATARKSLSHDYARYAAQLRDFSRVNGFPAHPSRIAEIGCGPGIVSLWLARQNPGAQIVGFDWSDACIRTSAIFADQLGLGNVSFQIQSFEDLSRARDEGAFDLVIAYHAFDGTRSSENLANVFSFKDLTDEQISRLSGPIAEACRAMASLLAPMGTGVITGSFNHEGRLCLFSSLRQVGLGVNWSSTVGNPKEEYGDYIFVGHRISPLGASAWEDTQAFLACGSYFGRTIELDDSLAESYSQLFRQGETLAELQFLYSSGGECRFRLIQDCGLLLLEETSTKGYRRGVMHSMAAVTEMYGEVARRAQDWSTTGSGTLTKEYVAPRLTKYIETIAAR